MNHTYLWKDSESVEDEENQQPDIDKMFTLAERHEVMRMKNEDRLYTKLA